MDQCAPKMAYPPVIPSLPQTKAAYSTFQAQLVAFERLCREAGSNRADEGEVSRALTSLSGALDGLLEAASA